MFKQYLPVNVKDVKHHISLVFHVNVDKSKNMMKPNKIHLELGGLQVIFYGVKEFSASYIFFRYSNYSKTLTTFANNKVEAIRNLIHRTLNRIENGESPDHPTT